MLIKDEEVLFTWHKIDYVVYQIGERDYAHIPQQVKLQALERFPSIYEILIDAHGDNLLNHDPVWRTDV